VLELSVAHLLMIGLPLVAGAIGWMTWISKFLSDFRSEVEGRSARQDTTLEHHERRISRIESVFYN